MKRIVLIVPLVLSVALPPTAWANDTLNQAWADIQEEWSYRPAAVIASIPAFLVITPFLLVKAAFEQWGGGGEEDGSEGAEE